MKLKIITGDLWSTRNQDICKITRVDKSGLLDYPIYGTINNKRNTWTEQGKEYDESKSKHDLMKKVTKQNNPEYFI